MTDTLSRAVQVATSVNGATYSLGATYDGNSRLTSVSYASGFTAKYAYTNLVYTNEMLDATSGLAYWTASAMDAEGHIKQQTAGNGLVTTRAFSLTTGRLNSIATAAAARCRILLIATTSSTTRCRGATPIRAWQRALPMTR